MKHPVVGLLPLYLELYDQVVPELRREVEAFAATIKTELEKPGVTVIAAPVCRVKSEFKAAVKQFEAQGAAAIVTLHLAYSPSLESIEALAGTDLPVIMLDTTPDYEFGFGVDPARIMPNHGIHGVQDLANMLLRRGKKFLLEAGHWQHSDVLARVQTDIKSGIVADGMKKARVGLVGSPFRGMGDFFVPFAKLRELIGMTVVPSTPENFAA